MWKIILSVFLLINNCIKAVNSNSNKVIKMKKNSIDNSIGKKVKNFSKAKSIKQLTKFKKPKAKVNTVSETVFSLLKPD